ncbi:MAG TPA: Uma2 family endonuclease [Planctomycetaceae bacterium]|nr:Uma2 family endonuclease [Planctomycetaceae bacterium]
MATQTSPLPQSPPPEKIPRLQVGDRLTRAEFERRYVAMPEINKAELVEGVVYMPSPVSTEGHGDPHFDLVTWIGNYRIQTPGVAGGDNATIRLDHDNEPQPDVHLRIQPEFGGATRIVEGLLEGPPELVAEVSATSVSYDLHDKLNAYRRNGVREYIVWRVLERSIDWFILREGRFDRLPLANDGIYRSEVFPGLWLDPAAMVDGNVARVLVVLQSGLAADEHRDFVRKLHSQSP